MSEKYAPIAQRRGCRGWPESPRGTARRDRRPSAPITSAPGTPRSCPSVPPREPDPADLRSVAPTVHERSAHDDALFEMDAGGDSGAGEPIIEVAPQQRIAAPVRVIRTANGDPVLAGDDHAVDTRAGLH